MAELKRLGFPALSVHKITTNRNNIRRNTPLMVVELERNNAGKDMYNLNRFMYLRVTVETLRRRSGPGQCHRCQRFDHAANCSTHTRRCANCEGPYPANYKGCVKWPKIQARRPAPPRTFKRKQTKEGTSFADALENKTEGTKQDSDQLAMLLNIITQLKTVGPDSLKTIRTLLSTL